MSWMVSFAVQLLPSSGIQGSWYCLRRWVLGRDYVDLKCSKCALSAEAIEINEEDALACACGGWLCRVRL